MLNRLFFVNIGSDSSEREVRKAMSSLYDALDLSQYLGTHKFVLIKIHFGEDGTDRFVRPKFVKALVSLILQTGAKVVIGDTNTLYPGHRSNAADHLLLADQHGFGVRSIGCPVMILDGLVGRTATTVKVDGRHFKKVELAYDLQFFDFLFVVTHFTGHVAAGIGGSIKNMGMGLATRSGKLAQHNAQPLKVDEKKCVACGICAKWCPQNTIKVDKTAIIDGNKCVSCGWCITVCKHHAIKFSWEISHTVLQERIAEYAAGVYKLLNKKVVCFNFLHKLHANCDCGRDGGEVLCEDLGIVAGYNPAAVDTVSMRLVKEKAGEDVFQKLRPEIDHTVQMRHLAEICSVPVESELVRLTLLGG